MVVVAAPPLLPICSSSWLLSLLRLLLEGFPLDRIAVQGPEDTYPTDSSLHHDQMTLS